MKLSFIPRKIFKKYASVETIFHIDVPLPNFNTITNFAITRDDIIQIIINAIKEYILNINLPKVAWFEFGAYKVSGWGYFEIPFKRRYSYVSVTQNILGWVDVPMINIKIPLPIFCIGIEKDRAKYVSFAQEGLIVMFLIGRES